MRTTLRSVLLEALVMANRLRKFAEEADAPVEAGRLPHEAERLGVLVGVVVVIGIGVGVRLQFHLERPNSPPLLLGQQLRDPHLLGGRQLGVGRRGGVESVGICRHDKQELAMHGIRIIQLATGRYRHDHQHVPTAAMVGDVCQYVGDVEWKISYMYNVLL
jgi:hypothetical protein